MREWAGKECRKGKTSRWARGLWKARLQCKCKGSQEQGRSLAVRSRGEAGQARLRLPYTCTVEINAAGDEFFTKEKASLKKDCLVASLSHLSCLPYPHVGAGSAQLSSRQVETSPGKSSLLGQSWVRMWE